MKNQKIDYLLRSALNSTQEKKCPYCGSTDVEKIDSKYIFTSLLSCKKCNFNHRHPKDDEQWLQKFYQKEYNIETHMTLMPSANEIKKLKEDNFPKLRLYDKYIQALFKSKPNVKMIDYGCSWGYNVFKLIKSGFNAIGFELSVPRAQFGIKNLAVPIIFDIEKLPAANDLILSSHVIEHLSDISGFVALSKKLLTANGVFMAFCPNGTDAYRKREPHVWHINWGLVHPNYLTIKFAQFVFKNNPYLILTGDWDFNAEDISNWDGKSQVVGSFHEGKELLIIAKPNIFIN
ncbi:MAG: hypothetical protein RJA07_840 [Bacteroidota bacterium]|jgi:ribosomal protein L37AE/L43A